MPHWMLYDGDVECGRVEDAADLDVAVDLLNENADADLRGRLGKAADWHHRANGVWVTHLDMALTIKAVNVFPLVEGTRVAVRHDDGIEYATTLRSAPWFMGGSEIVKVDGIAGGYLYNRVRSVSNAEWAKLTPFGDRPGRVTRPRSTAGFTVVYPVPVEPVSATALLVDDFVVSWMCNKCQKVYHGTAATLNGLGWFHAGPSKRTLCTGKCGQQAEGRDSADDEAAVGFPTTEPVTHREHPSVLVCPACKPPAPAPREKVAPRSWEPGNGSRYRLFLLRTTEGLLCAWPDGKWSHTFGLPVEAGWLREKGLRKGDAEAIARICNTHGAEVLAGRA